MDVGSGPDIEFEERSSVLKELLRCPHEFGSCPLNWLNDKNNSSKLLVRHREKLPTNSSLISPLNPLYDRSKWRKLQPIILGKGPSEKQL
ncbi:hypothetical protein LguiA_021882 [Lonicera macranthoides]